MRVYAALRSINDIEQRKEECRDIRKVNLIENFLKDIRYALRMIRRSPGFTVVGVISLALGIGANTAIFTLIDAVMLRSLPVRSPNELVSVGDAFARQRTGTADRWPTSSRIRCTSGCETKIGFSAAL